MSLTANIAARMRALRKARGWTAERLAKEMNALGVPWERTTVAKMETGHRSAVTVDELAALGEVFGASPWSMTTSAPTCSRCSDAPPAGFTCNDCGSAA